MGVRNVRESRNLQQRRDYSEVPFTRNQHLVKSSRAIAEILARKQAQMGSNAINSVDRREFYYFRRKSFGRVCSCALGENSSPSKNCPICYGVGFVGGYEKYGTWTEVLDYTFGDLEMVNVEPAYETNTTPVLLRLADGARKGLVRGTFKLRRNSGYCDAFQIVDSINSDNSVSVLVRESGTTSWIEANVHNMTTLMHADSLDFEVTLKRRGVGSATPYFSHLTLRYGLLPAADIIIPVDIPRNTEGISLLDYGWDEQFGSLQVAVDNRLHTIASRDVFYVIEKNRWLEVNEVQPFHAVGTDISADITCRFVQPYEAVNQVPA